MLSEGDDQESRSRDRWRSPEAASFAERIIRALQSHEDWRRTLEKTSPWGNVQDLGGIPLAETDLRGADLKDVYLSYADMKGANLDGADLSGALLTQADLRGATLRNTTLRETKAGLADFSGGDLLGAVMDSALLARASLKGANLRRVSLRGANLAAADLQDADLTHADLEEAILVSTRLERTTLTDANLKNVRSGQLAPPDGITGNPPQEEPPAEAAGSPLLDDSIDRTLSLEELDGERWPPPPADTTGLVKAVHELRRRPIESLDVDELRRLIGQGVGLPWILPLGLEILRDTAPEQARGGWYEDDLLYAVLNLGSATWEAEPELAAELKRIVAMLRDLGSTMDAEVEKFRRRLPEGMREEGLPD
ncbi:contact-dependent growth inhibition system immunity protein [Streptomyces sp. NPDC055078]